MLGVAPVSSLQLAREPVPEKQQLPMRYLERAPSARVTGGKYTTDVIV